MRLLGITALLIGASAANAHDLSGFYAGANIGARWSGVEQGKPLPTDDNFNTPTKAGFTVGGFAGYNFVYGPLAFGPEANL